MMKKENNITTLSDFPVPGDTTTERTAIMGIVNNPGTIVEIKRFLRPDMFEDETSRKVYKAILNLHSEGRVIDVLMVNSEVGSEFLKSILPYGRNTGADKTTLDHCMKVRDNHIRRIAYISAIEKLKQTCNPSVPVTDLMKQDDIFTDITVHESTRLSDALNDLAEYIEESMKAKESGKMLRIPTGFSHLNTLTYSGFDAGNLVILAARPSVGKTAVMLQMAKEAAKAGASVQIFSKEMQVRDITQRLVCSTEHITPKDIALARIDWGKYEVAVSELDHLNLYINDKADKMDVVLSEITLEHQRGKCDIAFIDYLGLFIEDNRKPLYQEIGEYTKRIKQLAMSMNIPIVLLCQLNRASASEKRPPEMHDLRDSGSIEQDADIVLMLEKMEEGDTEAEMNIWVRKNRNGKKDICIKTHPNASYTAFTEFGMEIQN